MDERQAFALAHPITDPEVLAGRNPYMAQVAQRGGNLLVSVLAVDR